MPIDNIYLFNADAKITDVVNNALKGLTVMLCPIPPLEVQEHIPEIKKPRLIIINIDGKDGKEVLRQIKADNVLRDVPILFLAASKDIFMSVPGIESGSYDFIISPYNNEELKTRLVKLLSEKRKWDNTSRKIADAEQEIRRKKLDLSNMMQINRELGGMDAENMGKSLLLSVMGSTLASNAALFTMGNTQDAGYFLRNHKGLDDQEINQMHFNARHAVTRSLIHKNTPVSSEELVREGLNEEEEKQLTALKAAIFIPLVYKNETLGILVLGDRLTGKTYSAQDIDKLLTTCSQAAAHFAHTRLQELRGTFSRYVSSDMIEYLMEHPDLLKLGGVKRKAVVFFADIRRFTTISEKLDPETVVKILNVHLSAFARIIQANGGLLDKFIGDCVMAEFGIPLSRFDDIERAARTALEIQARIQEISDSDPEMAKHNIRFGIGLHYGEVIAGNLGSDSTMDYTVIGDTVNTAARIEEMAGPGKILVTEDFINPIKNFVTADFIEEMSIRGKENKIRVYELKGFVDDDIIQNLNGGDKDRFNHFTQVANLNILVGEKLGYSEDNLRELKLGTQLLDAGRTRVEIDTEKSHDGLSKIDIEHIHELPKASHQILKEKGGFSDKVLDLVLHFHENLDGTGYPDGLKDDEISEWARICRISDAYIAMTNIRPYREPLSPEAAADILRENAGKKFDARIVDLTLKVLAENAGH